MFDGLHTFVTTEHSKQLNTAPAPKVIIASSGMCDAGRIRYHLKHNLWRKESLILFVGYQSNGTLGRAIYEGAKKVKLFGEEISVQAQVALLAGVSGHADWNSLLAWVQSMDRTPSLTFVNHSEDDACAAFVSALQERGMCACAPYSGSSFDLLRGKWIFEAPARHAQEQKKQTRARNQVYARLIARAEQLLSLARESCGRTAHELARFADAIEALIDRYSRKTNSTDRKGTEK